MRHTLHLGLSFCSFVDLFLTFCIVLGLMCLQTTDELLQELEFQVDSMAACSLDEMEPLGMHLCLCFSLSDLQCFLDESDEKIEQIEAGLEKLNELLAQLAHVAQA